MSPILDLAIGLAGAPRDSVMAVRQCAAAVCASAGLLCLCLAFRLCRRAPRNHCGALETGILAESRR